MSTRRPECSRSVSDARTLASRFSSSSGVEIKVLAPPGLWDALCDVDITPKGRWVAVAASHGSRVLVGADGIFPLQAEPAHPRVRAIDEARILLSAAQWSWIVSGVGEVERTLEIGGDVNDVLASESFIVAAFGDQSGFVEEPHPFEKALVVLDGAGEYLFGYHDRFREAAADAYSAEAVCWLADHTIGFVSYPGSELVRLDLATREQEVVRLPDDIVGSSAMSGASPFVFFHGAFERRHGAFERSRTIWRWRPGSGERPVAIGEFDGHLRGLRDGKFIASGAREFAILSCPTRGEP